MPLLLNFYYTVERSKFMATSQDKKKFLRSQIIDASHIYRNNLAGKVFLYVYGDSYFEVVFYTNNFLHLTGVASYLPAQDFYDKATASKLTTGQIQFDIEHSYKTAKKKLKCLTHLPSLTNSIVCVIKSMTTVTLTYKIGVTNLDFTLGLTENTDSTGAKINDWFSPRTLRVKDKAIENSADAEFIDFIFVKDASKDKYEIVTYFDKTKTIPDTLAGLLSQDLYASFKGIHID